MGLANPYKTVCNPMDFSMSGKLQNPESNVNVLLNQWEHDPDRISNIVSWSQTPAEAARTGPFPVNLSPRLIQALNAQGIPSLYSHQAESLIHILNGKNVVISTGTASGKSLCYSLAIWNQLLKDPDSTALCFFPTKALTYDQANSFREFEKQLFSDRMESCVSVYDGDTAGNFRAAIRDKVSILMTNPDMLHLGILPHHTIWARFLRKLRFVIIDELHTYRGVFGSHIANLIRRLKRICEFYGASPQFILTSATIGNPNSLAENLTESPMEWVSIDGSPKGERNFLIYNPPIVNRELGIRQGLLDTTTQLSGELMDRNIQTIAFCRTRKGVELLMKRMIEQPHGNRSGVKAYRSGYLRAERREIEAGLKSGEIKLAAATNALELGVDIGGVDAIIMAGYPGTIASTRQRAGRAGRKSRESLAVLVASSAPLDQYLALHPEFILENSPEEALINPNNPLILLQHIQCAAFELPFGTSGGFGQLPDETLKDYLNYLVEAGFLQYKAGRYFWMSQDYPAGATSLRSSNSRVILLQTSDEDGMLRTIGEVDFASSLWMVHPGAIYLQGGETFFVDQLDLEKDSALLSPSNVDFTTEPIQNVQIEVLQILRSQKLEKNTIYYGEIEVTSQVTGYKKIQWDTQAILEIQPLEMPATTLRTFGYWMVLNEDCVNQMRDEGMWNGEPNDYGPQWNQIRSAIRLRDGFRCQNCGKVESGKAFHVHHKVPFKAFHSAVLANAPSNLVTLCPECHMLAESAVRIRSAIAGVRYAMSNLAPLKVMCDSEDLESTVDAQASFADNQPAIMIYDAVPAGIGLSDSLFYHHQELLTQSLELISSCGCKDGCPSCVGPISPDGYGGKMESKRLLEILTGMA